jgi:serine/threonine-protein kinase
MALSKRVWGASKVVVLVGALLATYLLFAAASMRVALKTREVIVPEIAGLTVNEATTMLAESGLALRVEEGFRVDPNVPAGRIVAQQPEAGLRSRRQRSIRAWVSSGPPVTIVPAVAGMPERSARIRLQQDRLDLDEVAEIRSSRYDPGFVVAQSPPPKSQASRVALLVNRGERGASYVMPDLIGVNGDRAAELLRARGFRVSVVGEHPYPGVPAGLVIRQHPQGGFQIAPGEPISLEVSQ